jgi:hypothetical protein
MKLTWFSGTTVRIHIAGVILLVDGGESPEKVSRAELRSGAERVFGLDDAEIAPVALNGWRPRVPRPLIDPAAEAAAILHRVGPRAVLVDAVDEPPLLLLDASSELPDFGRWADGVVVTLFGPAEALVRAGQAVLAVARPKLIALAASEADIEVAITQLRDRLDGAGLVSLEPALAMEV